MPEQTLLLRATRGHVKLIKLPPQSNLKVKRRGQRLGRIIWRGSQWAVTAYGIECRDGTYVIEKERLWEEETTFGWARHMADKVWVDTEDFNTALRLARLVHTGTDDYSAWLRSRK